MKTAHFVSYCRILSFFLAAQYLLAGPTTWERQQEKEAAALLDDVAEDLEKYGTISASPAALIRHPKELFKFDLSLTPREIFNRARTEAASAVSDQRAFSSQTAVSAAKIPDLSATGAASGTNLSAELAEDRPAQDVLATEKFRDLLSIANPDTLNLPLRQLIQLSFDDYTAQQLLSWFGGTNKDIGENYILYAAILTVNVRPGWKTYTGYLGELGVRTEYTYEANEVVTNLNYGVPRVGATYATNRVMKRSGAYPFAFAVFPALNAQALDLRASIRRQVALSLLLQFASPKLGAKQLNDFVRRVEQDAASESFMNTVVGFNSGGHSFGWRFAPAFYAQGDPSYAKAKPSMQLQAGSFPALVFLVVNKGDIADGYGGNKKTDGYTHLAFFPTVRWLRAPAPRSIAHGPLRPVKEWWAGLGVSRLEEEETIGWARKLRDASEHIRSLSPNPAELVSANLRKRYNMLVANSVGVDNFWELPKQATSPEKKPDLAIKEVSPQKGWLDQPTIFVVKGTEFLAPRGTDFYVGGVSAEVLTLTTNTAVIRVDGWNDQRGGKVDLAAVTPANSRATIMKDAIEFSLMDADLPEPPRSTVEVVWQDVPGTNTHVKKIVVEGDDIAPMLLEQVSRNAEADSADVKVEVNAESKQ
jgi:hypothetical protein